MVLGFGCGLVWGLVWGFGGGPQFTTRAIPAFTFMLFLEHVDETNVCRRLGLMQVVKVVTHHVYIHGSTDV